jgi:thymidylate synthase
MNQLDLDYQNLLKDILENGVEKETRNGKTLSVFGRNIRYKFKDGKFPLITTKKMAFKTMVTELLWFLRGETNIKYLVDNNCHIWDGDCYQAYLKSREKTQKDYKEKWGDDISNNPLSKEEFINKIKTDRMFAFEWGELGPIYGKQWRRWETTNVRRRKFEEMYNMSDDSIVVETSAVDQIANLINDLKTNPDSRRLMVNAWNVGELDQMVLPPCHYGFQVYTRELSWVERYEYMYNTNVKAEDGFRPPLTPEMLEQYNIPTRAISLMWNQRSVDTFLGLPFNIASYGLLLEIIAEVVNMIPDELIGNLGDTHLYSNHIEQAKEQIGREPFELPTLKHMKTDAFYKSLSEEQSLYGHLDPKDFQLENYQSHSAIKAPLSN